MAEKFPIAVAHGYSRRESDGGLGAWQPDSFAHLMLDPEGRTALSSALLPFNHTVDSFLILDSLTRSRANLADPVAIVLFPRDYRLAGHFVALRGERADVKCSYCSYQPGDPPLAYPPLSLLYLPDWDIFADLASQSPLLAGAWDVLGNANRTQRWLCLADPLPEPWATRLEADDRKLFSQVRPA